MVVEHDADAPLCFRGKPHVDARSGDLLFVAYRGLRLFQCRVKRNALGRLHTGPVLADADLLLLFSDYRERIEKLVRAQIERGETSPTLSDLNRGD